MSIKPETVLPGFEQLEFKPHHRAGGIQARHEFENGYSVSVVRFDGSYGYEDGLYELAVIHGGRIAYDTPITDDVIGHLSPEAVTETMAAVAALPARATLS